MRPAVLSSALAPVALVGGFTMAATRQPGRYNSARDTISALAARGATDRWIMSAAFVALGCCHVVTATGLRRPTWCRAGLAVGGIATAALALAPQPAHGSSAAHVALAGVALIALAVWPFAGTTADRRAALGLTALLIVFGVALHAAVQVGVFERLLTVAEALWPIAAVHSLGGASRRAAAGPIRAHGP